MLNGIQLTTTIIIHINVSITYIFMFDYINVWAIHAVLWKINPDNYTFTLSANKSFFGNDIIAAAERADLSRNGTASRIFQKSSTQRSYIKEHSLA